MSKLCLTLTERRLDDCYNVLKGITEPIDLIELRVDYLDVSDQLMLGEFRQDIPVILTFRKTCDGGLFDGDENYRIQILNMGIKSGVFSYVDLEEDLDAPHLEEIAGENSVKIIRSFHDFNGVPKNLAKRLTGCKKSPDEIPKAAVMINTTKDLLEFYTQALSIKSEDKILLGMGNVGFNTRILAGKFGSILTFCSKEGSSAAPGHASPEVLNNVYRFKEINFETKIMGIIGNPVMHTKSPVIHNDGYKKQGLNSVYVPFETDDLESFLKIANLLNIDGFSVTVPFKTDIIPLVTSFTDSVKMIGACNTVTKIGESWIGENTDYIGFINPLLEAVGTLAGKKATIIGAGGSTKAALYALKEENVEVLVVNRTLEKAADLAGQFSSSYAPLNSSSVHLIKKSSDIIIQTTNAGMHPLEEIDPLEFYNFNGTEFLYDIIYTPAVTKFLDRGKQAGCNILNGMDMLKEQGYRQYKLFTGLDYPID
ncbi:MAG: shikimate dehydrogenase [Spirochaetaceae bacterium]